jgi:hypothetical protein
MSDAHVPSSSTVARSLSVQMRGARAGHVGNHRMISADCSRPGASVPVDGEMRIMITLRSPIRTSTSAAPDCFAARIARAMSAWVTVAGRRAMITARKSAYGRMRVIVIANRPSCRPPGRAPADDRAARRGAGSPGCRGHHRPDRSRRRYRPAPRRGPLFPEGGHF